jgi:thiaminase/transcriptional activator TenA
MTGQDLIHKYVDLWKSATLHPFIEGIRSGSMPEETFNSWLAQVYHFVREAIQAQARILAQAPREDLELLADGLRSVVAELSWLENRAQERGISLDIPLCPIVRAQNDFLQSITYKAYPHQITVLWALERSYLEAWKTTLPGNPTYQEFIEHWTTFDDYVEALEAATNRELAKTEESVSELFYWATWYMTKFWQMGYEGERLSA